MNTDEMKDYVTRLINAQESLIERMADMQGRIATLEQSVVLHSEILESARQVVDGHNRAIGEMGEAFGELHRKLQAINGNEVALQAELLRQREELQRLTNGGAPSALPVN